MQSAGAISPAPRARLPHPFPTGYDNGSKAFLDNFAFALRNELKDAGVTVSCLMPGTTETEFFRRAERPRGAVAAIVDISEILAPIATAAPLAGPVLIPRPL